MEVDQNSKKFTAESESPPNLTGTKLRRNAATDDENMPIGDGEIVGEVRIGQSAVVEMIAKKKRRGRPRKYTAVDLKKPPPVSPQRSFSSSAGSQIISKRRVGRPSGRGGLQLLASLGSFAWDTAGGSLTTAGGSLTPHIVHIAGGEDIVNRLFTFSRKSSQAICIISAVGLISTVLLHQPGSKVDTTLRFEGTFEILCMSGLIITEMNDNSKKIGQICISLAQPNGQVFGGVVASSLIAAAPIQVVVGSFKHKLHTSGHSSPPSGTEEEEICDAPGSTSTPQ